MLAACIAAGYCYRYNIDGWIDGLLCAVQVVDGEGHHVLNIAVKHKQDKVVQVR